MAVDVDADEAMAVFVEDGELRLAPVGFAIHSFVIHITSCLNSRYSTRQNEVLQYTWQDTGPVL